MFDPKPSGKTFTVQPFAKLGAEGEESDRPAGVAVSRSSANLTPTFGHRAVSVVQVLAQKDEKWPVDVSPEDLSFVARLTLDAPAEMGDTLTVKNEKGVWTLA